MSLQSEISQRNHGLGRLVVLAAWTIGVLVLSASAFRWLVPNPFLWLPPTLRIYGIENLITLKIRMIGLFIELIPFLAQMMILVPLRKLGHLLMNGDILIYGMSAQIRNIGNGFMLFALASGFYDMAFYTFTEFVRSPGTLKIHFGLNSSFFYLLVSSVVIRILSHAVDEGEKIKDENSQIV